ncbi:MAG: hypothetical protein FJ197_00725 [Gammaproteobacteria bacterium]|nr:hypothetical protein [Gammaproteobacteria bacterium]
MLPPTDPSTVPGPDTDDLELQSAGWDPYVAFLIAGEPAQASPVDDADTTRVMTLASTEAKRTRDR